MTKLEKIQKYFKENPYVSINDSKPMKIVQIHRVELIPNYEQFVVDTEGGFVCNLKLITLYNESVRKDIENLLDEKPPSFFKVG